MTNPDLLNVLSATFAEHTADMQYPIECVATSANGYMTCMTLRENRKAEITLRRKGEGETVAVPINFYIFDCNGKTARMVLVEDCGCGAREAADEEFALRT